MKNIVKSLIVLLSIVTISCNTDDVQDRPVIVGVDAPILTAPEEGNTYTLLPENMDQVAERFVWTAANYNGDVQISYTLQIDNAGGDFSNAQELGGTAGTLQAPITVETLNNACIALGATPYVAASFDVRVVSGAGSGNTNYSPMASNVVTIIITPFPTDLPKIWVPGSYQADSGYGDDWNFSTAPQLAASDFGKTDFEGYIYFATIEIPNDDGFKFTDAADWNNGIFADDGTLTGTLTSPGNNIGVSTPGYYRVRANIGEVNTENPNGLTYSTTLVSWGVIGSATAAVTGGDGWSNDANMTFDPTTGKWSLIITLSDGEIKFRYNDTWNNGSDQYNLGGYDAGADQGNYAGEMMTYGGANIAVTSGTYLIELDLSNPREYTYTLTPQ